MIMMMTMMRKKKLGQLTEKKIFHLLIQNKKKGERRITCRDVAYYVIHLTHHI